MRDIKSNVHHFWGGEREREGEGKWFCRDLRKEERDRGRERNVRGGEINEG